MPLNLIKIFVPATVAFIIGIGITPFVTHYLYTYRMWKKKARTEALGGGGTPIFNALHRDKEVGTPRMGGIVIWASVLFTTLFFFIIAKIFPSPISEKINFLSVNQTLLPLATLLAAAAVGLIDDFLQVYGKGTYVAGGLSLSRRILLVAAIALVGAWWFYVKLEVSAVMIPFVGEIELGFFFIPFFAAVMVALFSGGVIDGIDGLAGGIMSSIFAAYAGIAFFQNQMDIAAFSSVIAGGILAFLWFNIPPARFYMGETGMMGLTSALAVIAFLTNAVPALLVIAFPLFLASASVILQLASKKLRNGKKIFLVAPIHHHFEALGWPPYKVSMRFWVISIISALVGMAITVSGFP